MYVPHDKAQLISEIQGWFNTRKSIKVTHSDQRIIQKKNSIWCYLKIRYKQKKTLEALYQNVNSNNH